MGETTFKQNVLKYFKKHHPTFWFVKISDRWRSGIPDIVGCAPPHGKMFAIELKDKGKKPTPIQKATIARIQKAGGKATVCWTLQEVKEFIKKEVL